MRLVWFIFGIIFLSLCTGVFAVDVPFMSQGMDYFVNVQGAASVIPYGQNSSLRRATEKEKRIWNWQDPLTELYVADGVLYFKFILSSEPTEYGISTLPGLALNGDIYSVKEGLRDDTGNSITIKSITGNTLQATVDLMDTIKKGQILLVNFNFSVGESGKTAGFGKRKRFDLLKDYASDYSAASNWNTVARAAFIYLPAIELRLKASRQSIVIGSSLEGYQDNKLSFSAKVLDKYNLSPEIDYPVSFLARPGSKLSILDEKTNLNGEIRASITVPAYQDIKEIFQKEMYSGKDIASRIFPVYAIAPSAGEEHRAAITLNYYILSPSWSAHCRIDNDMDPRDRFLLLDPKIPKLFTLLNGQLLMLYKETGLKPAIPEMLDEDLTFLVVKIKNTHSI
ncbi:hypothetical protein ACFL4D_02390, partial [Candidatus Margulisiibacteriota bacterium]